MKKLQSIIFLIHCCIVSHAQFNPKHEAHFNFLGVKEGLPEGLVLSMIQDREGYMWIGTQHGIVRYDGYKAKKYNYKTASDYSNNVRRIYEDKDNNLWIGTDDGIYLYDRSVDTVRGIELYDDNGGRKKIGARFFAENSHGDLWISLTENKSNLPCVGLLNKRTNHLAVFGKNKTGSRHLNNSHFLTPFLDKKDRLWLSAENCLYFYNTENKKFETIDFDSTHNDIRWFVNEETTNHDETWFLVKDKKSMQWQEIGKYNFYTGKITRFRHNNILPNDLWQAFTAGMNFTDSKKRGWFCIRGGLLMFDPVTQKFSDFKIDTAQKNTQTIIWAYEDRAGNFWCWTDQGILFFNSSTTTYTAYKHDDKNPDGILSNYINHITVDNQGVPWFGVDQMGVQWLNKNRSRFTVFNNNPAFLHYFPGGAATDFAETANGNFYIASTHGLYFWKAMSDSFDLIPVAGSAGKDIYISRIIVASDSTVWFGGRNNLDHTAGLYAYNPKTKTMKRYKYQADNPSSLSNDYITAILEDKNKTLWIGTNGGGLCILDRQTQTFKRLPYHKEQNIDMVDDGLLDGSEVRSVYEDNQGDLWVGTNLGSLNKYNPQTGSFTSYRNLSTDFRCVLDIHRDSLGNIWAGTYMGGLFELKKNNSGFNRLLEKNGLLYDGAWQVEEDNAGNMWIGSARGFTVLNMRNGYIRTITGHNGLPVEPDRVYKTASGKFLYGSNDGFVVFDPADFFHDTMAPIVHIETVGFTKKLTGNRYADSTILAYGRKNIELHYNENRITFEYVALKYQDSTSVNYAYRLDGYDEDWVQGGTQRTVTYTNLSPGSYLFHIKASNADGVWSAEDSLHIVILPPWWKTWWAYLLYVILFLTALRIYTAARSHALKKQNYMLETKVEERTQQLSEANQELKTSQELLVEQRDELSATLNELKATQKQLIHAEKMASLGELTAGIAHEIQNPLNFVNNFSEVSSELIEELQQERLRHEENRYKSLEDGLLSDIKQNLERITQHGKRADAIVKGMLQHSRPVTGKKEPVDINALVKEYIGLGYHGMRAKDKNFNVTVSTDFDEATGLVKIVPQEIGRVLLNLLNNAFYTVTEKKKQHTADYEPKVSVKTSLISSADKGWRKIVISVSDNGNGISPSILNKIFQPFFTTKPTGEGTGLGLSLSYDIVTKGHGGELSVDTKEGQGSTFTIQLPDE